MENLKIALAQLDIDWEDKPANREKCKHLIEKASEEGAGLIVFPEMTLTGFSMSISDVAEHEKSSETVSFFKELAKNYKLNIIFGVTLEGGTPNKGRNMAMCINPHGELTAKYQKIHTISFLNETDHIEPGNKITTFEISGFKVALAICYDLRFPGLFEALSQERPDITIIIANWPESRIDHWDRLLSARALDLAGYVVGVNRTGEGGGLSFVGHSAVYLPGGELLVKMGADEDFGVATVDKSTVESFREAVPVLKDHKNNLYSEL